MKRKYDCITVTERDEGVVLLLPDGSSLAVPNDTVRRSAMLQEAIHTGESATYMAITLPQGVVTDWLQSVDALNAAVTSTGHGIDVARHPRLLKFLRVRCCSVCGRETCFVFG